MTTSPTPLSFGNMELLPETRHLLREVHRVSGTPVAVQLAQEMFPPLYFVPVGLRADDWLMENYPDLAVFRYFSVIAD